MEDEQEIMAELREMIRGAAKSGISIRASFEQFDSGAFMHAYTN